MERHTWRHKTQRHCAVEADERRSSGPFGSGNADLKVDYSASLGPQELDTRSCAVGDLYLVKGRVLDLRTPYHDNVCMDPENRIDCLHKGKQHRRILQKVNGKTTADLEDAPVLRNRCSLHIRLVHQLAAGSNARGDSFLHEKRRRPSWLFARVCQQWKNQTFLRGRRSGSSHTSGISCPNDC